MRREISSPLRTLGVSVRETMSGKKDYQMNVRVDGKHYALLRKLGLNSIPVVSPSDIVRGLVHMVVKEVDRIKVEHERSTRKRRPRKKNPS